MKCGRHHVENTSGFTIVEVMIVLAVTGALLISAIGLLGRSQNRTQFQQSINDINTQLGSVSLNVSNGYFATTIPTDRKCSALTGPNAKPTFAVVAPGGVPTDGSCVYLGRVVQFTDGADYFYHNVVGRRQSGAPAREVMNMSEANPQIIEPIAALNYTTQYPRTTEGKMLKDGLRLGFIAYKEGSIWKSTSGIAFMGSLAAADNNGDIASGAQTVDVAATVNATTRDDFILQFDQNFGGLFSAQRNPDSGIQVCFDSGSTEQRGLITIGGNGRRGTTRLDIQPGDCDAINPIP